MAKHVFLGDIHFGAKSNSIDFIKFQERFFKEQLFPYLLENDICNVIQVGDLFDTRTNINLRSLYYAKKNFFDVLLENDINLDIILGNHDIFYTDTLEINSPTLLLGEYSNIRIHNCPITTYLGNYSFDFIPWICKENISDVNFVMAKSMSDFCVGHFELSNFPLYKGCVSKEKEWPSILGKYYISPDNLFEIENKINFILKDRIKI